MRQLLLAATLMLSPVAAQAADIMVFSPGIANGPLRQLAATWTAETGNKVTMTGGNVGRIHDAVQAGTAGDLVLTTPAELNALSARLKPGSERAIGRIVFGVVVKAGGPHPDISTPEKFIAFAQKAGELAFANPAVGSLSGAMVAEMLKRPEFQGVRPLPIKGMIGDAIVRGDSTFGVGAISEELMAKDAEVVGQVPDRLGLFIDVSGAVLKVATAPAEADAFLAYITSPKAQAAWKVGGIVETPPLPLRGQP